MDSMRIAGITHVALDLEAPTRTERYLKEVFGLQTLRWGFWKGDYIRVMGSPDYQRDNPGLIVLHHRPGIPHGRLNHLGFGVRDQDVQSAVDELTRAGVSVDVEGDDMLYAPEDLQIQIDSFTHPRQAPTDSSLVNMVDLPLDPNLPCMVRRISHVAVEVVAPTRLMQWYHGTFGIDGRRRFARKGELISSPFYSDAAPDPAGRRRSLTPIYYRAGLPRARVNHISFEVADKKAAIKLVESRGVIVDLENDVQIYGPENIWYELDSWDTPFKVGEPGNDPGVRYVSGVT